MSQSEASSYAAKVELLDAVSSLGADIHSILRMLITFDTVDDVDSFIDDVDSRPELQGFSYAEAFNIGGYYTG